MRKLALGTAQFGMAYGIANSGGQVGADEIAAILALAEASSMDTLDTAIAYGESESRLGAAGVAEFRLVTKLPGLPEEEEDPVAWVRSMVQGSLGRLRADVLDGLLLHRPMDLLGPRGGELYRGLVSAREDGLVRKIGISVYAPRDIESLWPEFRFDLIQAPYSLVDRRIEKSGWLKRLKDAAVEIHTRSTFLQGLLLMKRTAVPEGFGRWSGLWDAWDKWTRDAGVSRLSACLSVSLRCPEIDRVVVGADSSAHLQQILKAAQSTPGEAVPDFSSEDEALINPSRWVTA